MLILNEETSAKSIRKGLSFQKILQELKASEGGKNAIFRLYSLIVLQSISREEDLLRDILLSLGSAEECPMDRFDAMYCLWVMTDNDEWSVEQRKEHVAYCYDYVSHGVDLDSHNDISPEHFEILKVLSNPDMFDHGASSKLLGCLIRKNLLHKKISNNEDEIIMKLGDKFLCSDSDEKSRKAFAIALFQKAAEQDFDLEEKKESCILRMQVTFKIILKINL